MSKGPIGVFDSGVGGLTVVSEIQRRFPHRDVIYFGDTARVPYGNKSRETVIRYSLEIGRFLTSLGVCMMVVACNTSSSWALGALEDEVSVPLMGMIEPGARSAVQATHNSKVGLIGTRATVSSGAYSEAIRRLDSTIELSSRACPLFVPLVEEGWADDPVALEVARRYIEPMLSEGIDTLILGCTHYPVLIPALKEVTGGRVNLISSASAASEAMSSTMEESDDGGSGEGKLTCYVTDAGTHFREVGERILGRKIERMVAIPEEELR